MNQTCQMILTFVEMVTGHWSHGHLCTLTNSMIYPVGRGAQPIGSRRSEWKISYTESFPVQFNKDELHYICVYLVR